MLLQLNPAYSLDAVNAIKTINAYDVSTIIGHSLEVNVVSTNICKPRGIPEVTLPHFPHDQCALRALEPLLTLH
jgi:hypothetical protein